MSATATLPVPVIPDSSPFSSAQRAWLNGFLAGLAGVARPAGAPELAPPAPAARPEESFPWHDPALSMDERLKLAEGRPRARVFMAAMAQLDCGACGYLCRTYAEAIADGSERDLTKCSPGGKATATKLKELVKLHPPAAPQAPAAVAAPPATAPAIPKFDRTHPCPARFVRATPLTAAGSDKDVRHVVIDLKGTPLAYRPGDSLGLYAENCPEAVQVLIELLGARGAEDVPALDGGRTSLREALLRDYTITRPTGELIELLARRATDPGDAEALATLAASDAEVEEGCEVIDLLMRHRSARPDPADLVATLSPLQPRLYSISSSQRVYPEEVHLTVGVVRYENTFGRPCKGVASTWLSERLRPGHRVRVFVQESHRFAPPSDPDVPMIMVGPGTGIAPFRAFLQERQATGARGMNWLFFGDRREAFDFHYRDELLAWKSSGLLTRLDTAFSRDGGGGAGEGKRYVQHRMLEHAAELWDWLQAGACFYVCGDAKRMAADVDAALRTVVATAGGMSDDQAATFVANLAASRRYQRDVY